ncbi:MAG TPA: PAS domain S-box protein [Terriglobales bacterium]|nr:PAS domain S-box protein [Terriglobales bacterium]
MSLTQREQMLLHAILNNQQISVISTGPDGMIQSFNPGAEALLGYKAEEVIGKVTPEIIHDPEEVKQQAERITKEFGVAVKPGLEAFTTKATITGQTEVHDWTYIRKDKSRIRVLLGVSILRDENGAMQGYVGVAMQMPEWERDVDRRRATGA